MIKVIMANGQGSYLILTDKKSDDVCICETIAAFLKSDYEVFCDRYTPEMVKLIINLTGLSMSVNRKPKDAPLGAFEQYYKYEILKN